MDNSPKPQIDLTSTEAKAKLKQAQSALQMLECGNIDLNKRMNYGILLLGNTKAGKTTSSHYLLHHVLQGTKKDNKSLCYMLKETAQTKYDTAFIGQNQFLSQTQIPNIFQVDIKGRKIHVIDCPGYIDSYGCFRIISNRFFHYQVFSKVQNMKFVLTFTFNDMVKGAEKMIKTFKQFLKGFANVNELGDQFINSISIMVTYSPLQRNRQQVLNFYAGTPDDKFGKLNQFYKKLKKSIVDNKRVYIFQQAVEKKNCNTQNKILEQIYNNSNGKFWERKLTPQGEIDMSVIKISVLDYLGEDPETFNKQLAFLQVFYKRSISKQLNNFIHLVYTFAQDTYKSEDSSQFIDQIITLYKQKKQWRKNQSYTLQLYELYKGKRNTLKNQLFSSANLFDSAINEIPFWLYKFKVFRQLHKLSGIIAGFENKQDKLKQIEQILPTVKNIMQMLITVSKRRKQKIVIKENEKNQAVLELFYQIYSNILISNKLYRLFSEIASIKKDQKIFSQQLSDGIGFIKTEYPSTLQSIFLKSFKTSYLSSFVKALQKFKFNQSLSSNAAKVVAYYLQQAKKQVEASNQFTPQQKSGYIANLDTKVANYFNIAFEQINREARPSLSLLKEMELVRLDLLKKIQYYEQKQKFSNENLKMQSNKLVSLMGQCLLKNNKLLLAMEIFDLIFEAHKIFEILQKKEQIIRKNQAELEEENRKTINQNLLDHLIQYMQYAKKYHRKQVAIQKAQKALYMAKHLMHEENINRVSDFLKKLCLGEQNNKQDPYIKSLIDKNALVKLPQKIIQSIDSLVRMQAMNL